MLNEKTKKKPILSRKEILFNRQGGKCYYCGIQMFLPKEKQKMKEYLPTLATLDHLRPKSKGGENSEKNSVVACYSCNIMKGNKRYFKLFNWFVFYEIIFIKKQ